MSTHSVAYDGQVMTLGQSLDENFRGVQKLLNDLHVLMRQMAMCSEQEIDEDEDYKESVLFEDQQYDIITRIVFLLEELIPIAYHHRPSAGELPRLAEVAQGRAQSQTRSRKGCTKSGLRQSQAGTERADQG